MVTLSTRRSARISVNKLGQRLEPNPTAPQAEVEGSTLSRVPVDVAEAAPIYSGPESLAFHKLASKNPALLDLVAALDLVEVSSTTIRPESLPALVERLPTEVENPKLKAIAQRTFAPGRSYAESEAIDLLATATNVSTDRARNGIALMYAQCILSLTLSHEYYLAESTPF